MEEVGVATGSHRRSRSASRPRCARASVRSRRWRRRRPRPRVVCIEWTDPLMVGGHWVPEMVRLAGGIDVLGEEGAPSRYVSWDEVVAARPEVMILMPCGYDLARTLELVPEVTSRPGFDDLDVRALRQGSRRRRLRVLQPPRSANRARPGTPRCGRARRAGAGRCRLLEPARDVEDGVDIHRRRCRGSHPPRRAGCRYPDDREVRDHLRRRPGSGPTPPVWSHASLGYSVKKVVAVPATPVRFATTATGAVECRLSAGTAVDPAMRMGSIWPGVSPVARRDRACGVRRRSRVADPSWRDRVEEDAGRRARRAEPAVDVDDEVDAARARCRCRRPRSDPASR